MPRMYFSQEHGAYVKECSCCKTVTVGVSDPDESIKIILRTFSPAGTSAGMADGLQSRCWICNSSKRRSLGVTRPILEQMYANQDRCCDICKKELLIDRNADPDHHAHVDHNEETGDVRGLLCGDCNRGIGSLRHNSDFLRNAAKYLDKHTKIVPLRRRA